MNRNTPTLPHSLHAGADGPGGLVAVRMKRRGFAGCGIASAGFTMVELLVVIGLIVVLLAILLTVSSRVFSNQKAAMTRNTMVALDRMLDEYMTATGTVPRYRPAAWTGRPSEFVGLADDPLGAVATGPEQFGDASSQHVRRPEVGVFLDQVAGYGAADSILESLPPQAMLTYRLDPGLGGGQVTEQIRRTVVDGWSPSDEAWDVRQNGETRYPMAGPGSRPLIYFVHPENLLAQELYGRCQGGRPYFLSAGADGRYGLGGGVEMEEGASADAVHASLDDNITSYTVGPANLSNGFFNATRDQTR